MIALEPQFALALIVALFGAAGSFFAVKFGGAETQRLVKALHARFDKLEQDVRLIELEQVRQDERLKALKASQRFRLQPVKTFTDEWGEESK